ncbi:MAG: alpha/beta hydrolase, partial [Actinomycetota bacterium]|nr:alpha/beta hydrolase [Actinomycetota bacterium]
AGPGRRRRTTPALLLHGLGQTSAAWGGLVAELARDREVLAPDLKGLGGSEAAPPYDGDTVAAELAALVLHCVDGPVDVVGHDVGGLLALALAGARPDLVRRLVVVAVPYGPSSRLRSWRAGPRAGSSAASAYRRSLGSGRPANGLDQLERALVLAGAADRMAPIGAAQRLAGDLGPATVTVTLPGAGHWPLGDEPALSTAVIAAFLREPAVRPAPSDGSRS